MTRGMDETAQPASHGRDDDETNDDGTRTNPGQSRVTGALSGREISYFQGRGLLRWNSTSSHELGANVTIRPPATTGLPFTRRTKTLLHCGKRETKEENYSTRRQTKTRLTPTQACAQVHKDTRPHDAYARQDDDDTTKTRHPNTSNYWGS